MATSGFLTVPTGEKKKQKRTQKGKKKKTQQKKHKTKTLRVHWDHWDSVLCEGLLGMKKDIAASAVMNCVFKKCELLLLYTVIDYMGRGEVSKNLAGCVDALS